MRVEDEAACARPGEADHRGNSVSSAAGRDGWRGRRGPGTGSARRWRWPISMRLAGSRGIRICSPRQIAEEWTRQTISTDPAVVQTVGQDADAELAGV